jgi:excisionase family DNA binding protein
VTIVVEPIIVTPSAPDIAEHSTHQYSFRRAASCSDATIKRVGPSRATDTRQPYLTVQELAEHLQVPVATVYSWNHKGSGPKAIKVGRHLRFKWTDVEQWLSERAVTKGRSTGSS